MAPYKANALRREIEEFAGVKGLNPLIKDLDHPAWDMSLGDNSVRFFDELPSYSSGRRDPQAELRLAGVGAPRDLAQIGGAKLAACLPGFGPDITFHLWKKMRESPSPIELPFNPDIATIVRLSGGDLGKVPVAAALKQWLPDFAVHHFTDNRPQVAEALTIINDGDLAKLNYVPHAQLAVKEDLLMFKERFETAASELG